MRYQRITLDSAINESPSTHVTELWTRIADFTSRHGVPAAAASQRRFSRLQRPRSALIREPFVTHSTEWGKESSKGRGREPEGATTTSLLVVVYLSYCRTYMEAVRGVLADGGWSIFRCGGYVHTEEGTRFGLSLNAFTERIWAVYGGTH